MRSASHPCPARPSWIPAASNGRRACRTLEAFISPRAPSRPRLECDILITADTNILALNNTTDAVVLFEADSGQKYMVRNGAVATPLNPQAGEGKASLKMFGAPAEDV